MYPPLRTNQDDRENLLSYQARPRDHIIVKRFKGRVFTLLFLPSRLALCQFA
jgi:hypothetical protein